MLQIMNKFSSFALVAFCALSSPLNADSSNLESGQLVEVSFLEGWRSQKGDHIAAVTLRLAEGWKTYWRAPGDGGLPTHLSWEGSENLQALDILWPRPEVFETGSMRSLGYRNNVTLPLQLTPGHEGAINLTARLYFGICKEVCVPVVADLQASLTDEMRTLDPRIESALEKSPVSATVAQVGPAYCTLSETVNGSELSVEIDAPMSGIGHTMVVEADSPEIWVGSTKLRAQNDIWYGTTILYDSRKEDAVIALDAIRITLFTDQEAVDIKGCSPR